MGAGARLLLLLPFTALLGVFFAAPLALMVAISLSRQSFGELQWTLTLHHYARFFSDAYYIGVLWDTLVLGAIVTVSALLLGYPVAYHLARTRSRVKPLLLVAVLSPLLVGIVIRCYGWMILLADRGLINATLVERGWLARPLPLMYNRFGVAVALVHVFLPFMVLSLTGVLKRIDPHALEAALTLGASPRRAFLEVTLPLSLPGILAGSLRWFANFFARREFMQALRLSTELALWTAVLSTLAGTLAAIALVRGRFRGRDAVNAFVTSPLLLPQILTGVAMLQFFTLVRLHQSYWALLIGHVVVTTPYVVRTVSATLTP